jgi:hypothetical protein
MKKLLSISLIILMLGAVFGITLHQISAQMQDEAPVIAQAIDFLSPAIAYADSDTVGGKLPLPPPPPKY